VWTAFSGRAGSSCLAAAMHPSLFYHSAATVAAEIAGIHHS
jgi:hypothetical protein